MIVLLSPAKSLDFESPLLTKRSTQPRFVEQSSELIGGLRKLSVGELGQLMSISEKLAQLNHDRFASWEPEFTTKNSRPAILAFTGDVYQGMDLKEWSSADFTTAQKRVRILSGLYGVLRPLDLMQPYRLEMGTKFANKGGKNLYGFWGESLTEVINADLKKSGSDLVVNLASNEYFSAIKPKVLDGELITPVFKDEKNGKYKIISFYAKKARGMMADFIVRENITDAKALEKFRTAGYKFSKAESDGKTLVFLRKEGVA
ncbi:peroxide stress protein YaaA [Verrucomicrobiaceae bacterium 227]